MAGGERVRGRFVNNVLLLKRLTTHVRARREKKEMRVTMFLRRTSITPSGGGRGRLTSYRERENERKEKKNPAQTKFYWVS